MSSKPERLNRHSSAETREHVLEVAGELFYWNGIRATGVDKIVAEAGVAPTTLYRLFGSKDDLIAAYVERADRLYREWFTNATVLPGTDPRQQLLALFDALEAQVAPQQCRGCPFLMALTEFPDPTAAAHTNAVTTKSWVREQLGDLTTKLAARAAIADPATLADQLAMVLEGAYASAQALGATGPAKQARAIAETLIDTAARR